MFLSSVRAILHLCLTIALYLNILGRPVMGKDAKANLTVTAIQPQLHGQYMSVSAGKNTSQSLGSIMSLTASLSLLIQSLLFLAAFSDQR